MLEEKELKRKEEKKKNSVADTSSKEKTKSTSNAPTTDSLEEEVRWRNENNKEKEGIKDNVSHTKINNQMRELNSGAGAKDNDTDNMEEDPLPRNNKSRESKKR